MAKLLVETHAHSAAKIFRVGRGNKEQCGEEENEQAVHEQVRLGGCHSVTGASVAVDLTNAGA